jgi:16S rRNA (cytidine1402-2'-O)-methyltransferase
MRAREPRGTAAGEEAVAAAAAGAGTLYVVATPIGNLGDVTLRALETLRSVRLIAAEDTRHTRALLSRFEIHTPLTSYHHHNRAQRLPRLLAELARGDVALVADAGTPAISDPGQELVAAAAAAGHQIVAVPGPSSVAAAVSIAGLDAVPFHFLGFLPRRAPARRRVLAQAATWPGALVLFEAPHRLRALLADLLATLGDRRVAVCGELTKLYEQVHRGTLSEAAAHFERAAPRGEYTLVVAGHVGAAEPAAPASPAHLAPAAVRRRFEALQEELGGRRPALAALAAETGQPRKTLYRQLIQPSAVQPCSRQGPAAPARGGAGGDV